MKSRPSGIEAGERHDAAPWVPPWVETLGMPVWISGPDRYISYINGRAERLLNRTSGRCVGRPCYGVIKGRSENGKTVCRERCPVFSNAGDRFEVEPFRLRIGTGRRAKSVQVVVIAARAPDCSYPHLIHCVIDDDRERRFRQYLRKVMARSSKSRDGRGRSTASQLTHREKEILALLSDDASLREIADKLHLSYTTVRNHVQHILGKLGVHSTMEAVAFYLLSDDT